MADLTFFIECPTCNSLVLIYYNEQNQKPGIQNECLTVCDDCGVPFCLLPTKVCEECVDYIDGDFCAQWGFVDVLKALRVRGLIQSQRCK